MEKFLYFVGLAAIVGQVAGHGRLMNPIGRSSIWRKDKSPDNPRNYNDHALLCGGFDVQLANGNKCGVCGDAYNESHPQPNENTGTYGRGVIVANYKAGEVIDVHVDLTSNHLGQFSYQLCEIEDSDRPESGEECFKPLEFADGRKQAPAVSGEVHHMIKLPDNFTCTHCVLRWNYKAANNFGVCEDGTKAVGCGPQRIFRNCADITIE